METIEQNSESKDTNISKKFDMNEFIITKHHLQFKSKMNNNNNNNLTY